MLTNLDHIVLLCRNIERAKSDYALLLGTDPILTYQDHNFKTAIFQTSNTGLEIMAPIANSASESRAFEILGDRQSALTSLAFVTDDVDKAHHVLRRRGLDAGEITSMRSGGRKFRLSDESCHGVKTFIISNDMKTSSMLPGNGLALDHLVINTSNPDRAIAHYGARLGIRFALDRRIEQFGARFMFFKIASTVLEVIYRLNNTRSPDENDSIWGLTWKVDDLEFAHQRLSENSVEISEIRTGRKPGSRVFTVKSLTGGIPTLFISHA